MQGSADLVSTFMIVATARPGHTVDELKTVIDEELEKLRQTPPDTREVQRAIHAYEAAFFGSIERIGGFGGKADLLNAYYTRTGIPDYFAEDLARYQASIASDVQAVVQRYLPADARVELDRAARGRQAVKPIAALVFWCAGSPPSPARRPIDPRRRRLRRLPRCDCRRSSASPCRTGCRVWLVERHDIPVVQVGVVIFTGATSDPQGKFGLASLTAAMLDEGAGGRNALEIADAIDFLGAGLGASSSYDASARRPRRPGGTPGARPRGDERRPPLADVSGQRAGTTARRAADRPAPGARRRRIDRGDRISEAAVRRRSSLWDGRQRHARHHPIVHGGRSARVSRRALPSRQCGRDRRRRRDPRIGQAAARNGAGHVESGGAETGDRNRARGSPAVSTSDLSRGQARCGAIGNHHRRHRRRPVDARLLCADGAQYRARRIVHVAAQSEPARNARVCLRRRVAVRPAQMAGAVSGRRGRSDRQDGRVADRVLQGAGGHPQTRFRTTSWAGHETISRSGSRRSSKRSPRWPRRSKSRCSTISRSTSSTATWTRFRRSRPPTLSGWPPATSSPTSSSSSSSAISGRSKRRSARSSWARSTCSRLTM